jgi:hypothetical protein
VTTIRRVTTLIAGPTVNGGGVQTFYFANAVGTAAQLTAAVQSFWNYNPAIFYTGTTFAVQSEVESLNDANGQLTGVATGTAATVTGSGAAEALSPATQGLVRWRTGVVEDGREIRGRTFMPAMVAAQNDDGHPIAGCISAMTTAAGLLISDANSELIVWRRPRLARPQVGSPGDRYYLPAQSARDGSSATVTSGTGWDKWAVLRSRRD